MPGACVDSELGVASSLPDRTRSPRRVRRFRRILRQTKGPGRLRISVCAQRCHFCRVDIAVVGELPAWCAAESASATLNANFSKIVFSENEGL